MGAPAYMASEQLDGSVVDRRADLFAAGALLFEVVTGRSSFAAASNLSSMHAVLEKDVQAPTHLTRSLPARETRRTCITCR